MTREKIAIFGGTFNPPHSVHVKMVESALEQLDFDRVLIIPTFDPPHKQVTSGVGAEHRLEMARLAFRGIERVEISDIEILRSGKSYTYDTVCLLKEEHPDCDIFLIVGEDMLETLENWYRGIELMEKVSFLAFDRGGYDTGFFGNVQNLREKYNAKIVVSDMPPLEKSSTEIRENGVREDVPKSVEEYIKAHKLYGEKTEKIEFYRELLKSRLSEKRYKHSLSVEKEAVRLAKIHGLDTNLARLAGLLHDITKEENYKNQLKIAEKHGIMMSNLDLNCPKILHEITAAPYLKNELGIENADILNGVRYHSTGRSGMSEFEKLIFVADLSEETRKFQDIEIFREMASRNLDEAVMYALNMTINKMLETEGIIHTDTVEARNDLLIKQKKI